MATKFGWFDVPLGGDPLKYKYSADEMRDIFSCMLTNGIVPEVRRASTNSVVPITQLGSALSANIGVGLKVTINMGIAWINGAYCIVTAPEPVDVSAGIINDIVLRVDLNGTDIIYGVFSKPRSASTIQAGLTRSSGIYELGLHSINVPAGATQVTKDMITDHRLNMENGPDGLPCCGIIGSMLMPDVDAWYRQATQQQQDWYKESQRIIDDLVAMVIPDGSISESQLSTDVKNRLPINLAHVKQGTVHAFTGLKSATGKLSCIASTTAPYVTGDTATVDGVPYTIVTANGEPLEDNAWVANRDIPVLVDTVGNKLGFKLGGGSSKTVLNLFCQSAEPPVKEGIWIQTANKFNQVAFDKTAWEKGTWINPDKTYANYPTQTQSQDAYFYNNKIFYVDNQSGKIKSYDVTSKTFTQHPAMPKTLSDFSTCMFENKIICCGGLNSEYSSITVFSFNMDTLVWSSMSDLLNSSHYGCCIVYKNKLYVFNNLKSGGNYAFYQGKLNITDLETDAKSLITIPVNGSNNIYVVSVFEYEDIIVLFGFSDNYGTPWSCSYNITTNEFTSWVTSPIGTPPHNCFDVGNYVHLISSCPNQYVPSANYTKHWIFNKSSKTYTKLADIPITNPGSHEIGNGLVAIMSSDRISLCNCYSNNALLRDWRSYAIQSKAYTDKTLVIIPSDLGYATQLFSDKRILNTYAGRMLSYFSNAWLYTDNELQGYPTYYGNGTSWVKFKN
ncbi:hypothetical protein RBG61_01935 [Paludicola sp. MB14-C6]|uniref:hypothetical protein n=1 Tax=Paludihabitans sp. MB14-C6 TaxID=3070656 RepID=UPI0027DC291C|nr:hypothetical protein [Paludicola sp. MB14-C6]WMJ23451.1 hypothetical protein RBG61_01935 [Paludicola sp. MB14-C6]